MGPGEDEQGFPEQTGDISSSDTGYANQTYDTTGYDVSSDSGYENSMSYNYSAPDGLDSQAVGQLSDDEVLNLANKNPINVDGTCDALCKAEANGLIDVHSLEEHERQLRFNASNYSWMKGPADELYAQEHPEEARAEAEAKWNEFVRQDYAKYRDRKAAEWEESSRKMESLGKLGKGIAWVPVAVAAGFVAAEVATVLTTQAPRIAKVTTAAGGAEVLANEIEEGTPKVIEEGQAFIGVVKDGIVLTYRNISSMLSHAELIKRELGTLPEGARVITFGKESGEIWVLNSINFHGNQSSAPADAWEAILKAFK
jgi:hypothetical protein